MAADTDSMSGKAEKARKYGVPIVGEVALRRLLPAASCAPGPNRNPHFIKNSPIVFFHYGMSVATGLPFGITLIDGDTYGINVVRLNRVDPIPGGSADFRVRSTGTLHRVSGRVPRNLGSRLERC